jgi:tetratricopeptide (TPR) repeat protein
MFSPDAVSPNFLNDLVSRIVRGEPLSAFCDWFVTTIHDLRDDPRDITPIDDQSRRMMMAVARQFWSHVPRPANQWRPQTLPKIERNDPCYCGSGKKYKQCCVEFAGMPMPLENDVLFALALDCIDPTSLQPSDWVSLPPMALAQAATFWSDRGDDERVVQVLGAYFNEHPKLDERSEYALDQLFGALQDLGMHSERFALAVKLSEHKNKAIATTARCRHVVLLSDRGDYAAAWKVFAIAQRGNPTDPQLTHLEMMVLLSEGRDDEAALRSKTLAAQLRRRGPDFDDLADTIEALGRNGMAAMGKIMADREETDQLDEAVMQWMALFQHLPAAPATAADWTAHYTLQRGTSAAPGTPPDGWLTPSQAMNAIEKKWSRAFPTTAPRLTDLDGDADALLDDLPGVTEFLRNNPDAWHSFAIMDDVLAAGYSLACDAESAKLDHSCLHVALRGVTNLRAVIGTDPVVLPWAVTEHRPALRAVARAIELCEWVADTAQMIELAAWMLAINPNDNHGFRTMLVGEYLHALRAADALAVLHRYPDDMPVTGFDRALCLFLLDRKAEAADCWAIAAKANPHVPELLLAATLEPIAHNESGYVAIGSLDEAFDYVTSRQSAWVRAGAIDWARTLPKVKVPKPSKADKATRTTKSAKSTHPPAHPTAATSMFQTLPELTAALWAELDPLFADTVVLHGYTVGIAMSPGYRNDWMSAVMSMLRQAPSGQEHVDKINAAFKIVLNLHNGIRADLVEPQHATRTPAAWLKPIDMAQPGNAARWAKGYVRAAELCAAEWRRAKLTVNSATGPLAPLYLLASRAPLDSPSSAPNQAWRVENEAQRPMFAEVTASSADSPSEGEQVAALLVALQAQLAPFNGPLTQ